MQQPVQMEQPNPVEHPLEPKRPSRLPIVFGFLGLVVLGVVAWLLYTGYFSKQPALMLPTPEPQTMTDEVDTSMQAQKPGNVLFSGSLKRLDRDLELYLQTDQEVKKGEPTGIYYEAGTFLEGPYKGYTRIVAVSSSGWQGGPFIHLLATNDFQTYVLDDPNQYTSLFKDDDWQNPFHDLDRSKISGVAVFDTEQPPEIELDQDFSLVLESRVYQDPVLYEYVETGARDQWDQPVRSPQLVTDFSSYKTLQSPYANLKLYSAPFMQNADYYDQLSEQEKQAFQVRKQYFISDTEVIVVDSVGLPMKYSLTTHQAAQQYDQDLAAYQAAFKKYQASYNPTTETYALEYPNTPSIPGLGFSGSEVTTSTDQKLFSKYSVAVPAACAGSNNTRVVSIDDQALAPIGTLNGRTIYRLVDDSNPLNELEYDLKFGYYDQEPTFWQEMNKGLSRATLSEYVAQSPLLFMKDYWNRWVAVGEYDYQLQGGCGKPVMYLYPEHPTQVELSFLNPMQFTTDIPTYQHGWRVLAQPNGQLTDLQPEATNCEQLKSSHFGSEYAAAACAAKTYPYLYWAGNSSSTTYPIETKGWIVSRGELDQFFTEKLAAMGFSPQESQDFKAYWVPTLGGKEAPYFRISFFQTNQVNQLFPLHMEPQPDSVLRMFMDYTALETKPAKIPEPQQLQRVRRDGFTLVEWGGLQK